MGERQQITYMQTRMSRMACQRWGLSLAEVMEVFSRCDVFGYIERNFGIFHMEGDEAIFDDVETYMRRKGVTPLGTTA